MKDLKKKKTNLLPYFLIAPTIILFTIFSYYPFIKTIFLSFAVTDKSGNFKKWVGIANFKRIFSKSSFWLVIGNTFKFAFIVMFGTLIVAMVLALISYKPKKGGRIYQTMYAIPMSIASVPASAMFLFMFKKDGFINRIFGTSIAWLTTKEWALPSVAIVTVWLCVGSAFIFLLVGFRGVPEELIESATIDGANSFQKAFKILIPVASPQIFFVVFLVIGSSFKAFGQVKLLTEGGPANASEILVYSIYKDALLSGRFETACADALVLFLIIFVFTRIQFAVEDKVVFYK